MKKNYKITIVDYDCGNLFSIERAMSKIGANAVVSSKPEDILSSDKIILPGVGAFGDAMSKLKVRGLADAILRFVALERPILGICLGMQLLFNKSFEFGRHQGLNLIDGNVIRLNGKRPSEESVKVPHVGWSPIFFKEEGVIKRSVLNGLKDGAYMYFLHSFCVLADGQKFGLATANYGENSFCAVVRKGNITGVQFHPEISGVGGLKLLENFILS